MHIEENNVDTFRPNFTISMPDGNDIQIQSGDKDIDFSKYILDFPNIDTMQTHKFVSSDKQILFHYIIHPGMKAIFIPPNSIKIDEAHKNKGIGSSIQRFFEIMAQRHGYRLLVGVTLQSAAAFNNRVINILLDAGYSMGHPTDLSEIYVGIFRFKDNKDENVGIPELGIGREYMISRIND